MTLELHPAPWTAFAGLRGLALGRIHGQELDWAVLPRLVGRLPRGFLWNGRAPVLAAHGGGDQPDHYDPPLPEQGSTHVFRAGAAQQGEVRFLGIGPRAREQDREDDPRERWLHWQYQRYKELAHIGGAPRLLECEIPLGARREWSAVEEEWRQSGEDQAEVSLIVDLARRQRLLAALQGIATAPRRMLRRRHRQERLSRVRETDQVALRDLARRPGRTATEKAGPRQQVLAVVREETTDLPENRVLLWCVRRMERMARSWCERNARFRGTVRYEAVARLLAVLRRIQRVPALETVSSLQHHMVTPTYCFQFENRYREVWNAYVAIRREEQVVDDLWRWHGHLWGGTARLILGALLTSLDGWHEKRLSTPFFRTEGTSGEWTLGPSVPGPFTTPVGDCHVLDLREEWSLGLAGDLALPADVHGSGADWVLVLPDAQRVLLAWSAVWGPGQTPAVLPGLDALDRRLAGLTADTEWDCRALVLLGEPEVPSSEADWVENHGRLHVLHTPTGISALSLIAI